MEWGDEGRSEEPHFLHKNIVSIFYNKHILMAYTYVRVYRFILKYSNYSVDSF